MLLVAPFLWFLSIGGPLILVAGPGLFVMALVAVVGGFGIFIYGLVAEDDLERAAIARQATAINQPGSSPQLQGKYCANCGSLNPLGAGFCVSCGVQFPAG